MPSSPAALRGADMKIVFRISMSMTSVQARAGPLLVEFCGRNFDEDGNIIFLKRIALSINVDAVFPSCLMMGVCCIRLGLSYFSPS